MRYSELIESALKTSMGISTIVSSAERRLFNKVQMVGFMPINKLTEREQYLAQQMLQKNVLIKETRKGIEGYEAVKQISNLNG